MLISALQKSLAILLTVISLGFDFAHAEWRYRSEAVVGSQRCLAETNELELVLLSTGELFLYVDTGDARPNRGIDYPGTLAVDADRSIALTFTARDEATLVAKFSGEEARLVQRRLSLGHRLALKIDGLVDRRVDLDGQALGRLATCLE